MGLSFQLIVQISESQSKFLSSNGDLATVTQPTTIKLFGRTVLVTESKKPNFPTTEFCKSPSSKSGPENLDICLSVGLVPHNSDVSSPGAAAYCLELQKDKEGSCDSSLQGLSLFGVVTDNKTNVGAPVLYNLKDDWNERETTNETSCTGSSGVFVSRLEHRDKHSDADIDSKSSECRKGFVPYKRCLMDGETKSEERASRRARVCS